MKIGVSSYNYIKDMWAKKIDGCKMIEKAKEEGFSFIDFSPLPDHDGDDIEYAKSLAAHAKEVGIEIFNYAVGADFINGSDKNSDKEIEKVLYQLDIAKALGAKSFRHDAVYLPQSNIPFEKSFDYIIDKVADCCRVISSKAKEIGIETCVENHGFYCQDSDRIEKLVSKVGFDNFGLLLDIGNFLCVDEDPAKAVGRLLPLAKHIHIKDFIKKDNSLGEIGQGFFKSRGGNYLRGTIVGHGVVPVKQCLDLIKSSGYDKTLTLEFEGIEDIYTAIKMGKDNIERWLK